MLGRKSHDNTVSSHIGNSDKNKMLSNFATFRQRSQDAVQTKFPSHFQGPGGLSAVGTSASLEGRTPLFAQHKERQKPNESVKVPVSMPIVARSRR